MLDDELDDDVKLDESIAVEESMLDESTVDENNPFGKGVSKALQFIADLARKDGFIVNNYGNYVVEILTNELDKNITFNSGMSLFRKRLGSILDDVDKTIYRKNFNFS